MVHPCEPTTKGERFKMEVDEPGNLQEVSDHQRSKMGGGCLGS